MDNFQKILSKKSLTELESYEFYLLSGFISEIVLLSEFNNFFLQNYDILSLVKTILQNAKHPSVINFVRKSETSNKMTFIL